MITSAPLQTLVGLEPRGPEAHVLGQLIQLGCRQIGADEGSLLVLDATEKALVFTLTVGVHAFDVALVGKRVPIDQGITGLAASTRKAQTGEPAATDLNPSDGEHATGELPIEVLAAPMVVGERLVGVLTAVRFDETRRFADEDAVLYGRLAAAAAVIVDQAQHLVAMRAKHGLDPGSQEPSAPQPS